MKASMETLLDCVIPYIHDADDLNSLSLVSRKFYQLDCITRKHVTVHLFYALSPSTLSKRFPFVESLTLKGPPHKDFPQMSDIDITPWIEEIAVKFVSLKALHIRGLVVCDEDLELLARTRDIDDDDDLDASKALTLLVEKCSESLVSLKLRELKLEGVQNCQCFFFKKFSNLEVLHTGDVCGDKGLRVIGQICKKLRKLAHYGDVTHKGLIALAQGCPNLESLDVRLKDISNKALKRVGTQLKHLHDFYMYMVDEKGITDSPLNNGIRAMLKGCIKLKKLGLNLGEGGLTDVGLGYIGKYGYNLRCLTVLTELTQYVTLAEKLLRAMVAKGIRVNEEQVIIVDGSSDKPLEIIKVQIANVESRLAVAISESGEIKVEGRVKDGVPHLTKVGALDVDVSLEGNIILCRQADQPNIIVRVGSILDDDNVIISSMSFGGIAQRKQAIMVIGVDKKPSKKALKKIDKIPAVEEFLFFALKAIPRVVNSPTPYIASNIPSVEPDVLQMSAHATRMTDAVSRPPEGGDQVTGSTGSILTLGKGKRNLDDRLDHSLESPLTHNRQRTNESDNTSVANNEFQGPVNIKTNSLLFDAHTSGSTDTVRSVQYQSSSGGHEQQGAPASCIGSDISNADLGGSCSSTYTMRLLNLSRAKGKRKKNKMSYSLLQANGKRQLLQCIAWVMWWEEDEQLIVFDEPYWKILAGQLFVKYIRRHTHSSSRTRSLYTDRSYENRDMEAAVIAEVHVYSATILDMTNVSYNCIGAQAVSDANKAIEMDAWLLYGLLMKVYDYNWLYAAIIGEKPNVEWNHVSVLQSAKQASQFAVMLELFDCSC
ncbi:D-3-phosphoglycerate dehydrogenase 1, chloroplastic-like protein [Tanacetum coccineum]